MALLIIRKLATGVFEHLDPVQKINGRLECKTTNGRFIVTDPNGSQRLKEQSGYLPTEIQYYTLGANSPVIFPTAIALMTGLRADGYVGFDYPDGVVIADLISTDAGNILILGTDGKLYAPSSGGGGSVESVTGLLVNNTDPANPVINIPTLDQVANQNDIPSNWTIQSLISSVGGNPYDGSSVKIFTEMDSEWFKWSEFSDNDEETGTTRLRKGAWKDIHYAPANVYLPPTFSGENVHIPKSVSVNGGTPVTVTLGPTGNGNIDLTIPGGGGSVSTSDGITGDGTSGTPLGLGDITPDSVAIGTTGDELKIETSVDAGTRVFQKFADEESLLTAYQFNLKNIVNSFEDALFLSDSGRFRTLTGRIVTEPDMATALEAKADLDGAVFTGAISATNLSGTNSGNETTTTIGALINSATAKTSLVDADMLGVMDSAASNVLKKWSFANAKANLKTYFDTLYQSVLVSGTNIKTVGGQSLVGSGNITEVQNSLAASTVLAPSATAVNAALADMQRYFVFDNTTSSTVTGVTTLTLLTSYVIPANTLTSSSLARLELVIRKTGSGGNCELGVYLNGTTISDRIGRFAIAASSQYTNFRRNNLLFKTGNVLLTYNSATSAATDDASATAISPLVFDPTINNTISVYITPVNAGDSFSQEFFSILGKR